LSASSSNQAAVTSERTVLSRSSGKPVQTVAVIGGKGGVGVTNVAVNLAVAMSEAGHDMMLMDGHLALGNVDCLLDLQPEQTLADVNLCDTQLKRCHRNDAVITF